MQYAADPDLHALQGAWEQISLEDNGVLDPVDAHTAPGAITTIAGNGFEVRTTEGNRTEPKSITWIDSIGEDAGKALPASYRLEGDTFVFIAADEHMPRPTVFKTGPGQTMRTFVRRHS
jgi:uncharacterized protein (TIGR03067 family)